MSGRRPSPYIVGRAYDWAFFLLPPLASLALGIAISGTAFTARVFTLAGQDLTGAKLAIGVLTHAHLVAVFLRSHGNPSIRHLHPVRFLLVPLLLFGAIRASPWLAVTATVVATWWDVWHSGAQTFGFGRIYDRNAGNPPLLGRRLDYWLNHLLYAGPILGGVTLVDHLADLDGYHELGTTLFSAVPTHAVDWRRHLAWGVLAVGTTYLVVYVLAYVRLYRRGYRVSFHKVFLVATTGACSIYTWGLNSWGEAFFIMNLFHAVQYLALVWATEQRRLADLLGPVGRSRALVYVVYLGAVLAYGVGAELVDVRMESLWAITMVVSILHFWYDGFIWSVAKRQI
jgi:hypothetical protein